MATKKTVKKKAKNKAQNKVINKAEKKIVRSYGGTIPLSVKNNTAKKAKTGWQNPTQFEILEDVPLPWTRITTREIIFPFAGMGIGQSFQFMKKEGEAQNTYSAACSFCKQPEHFHKRFVVRKISEERLNGVAMIKWGCWREDDLTEDEITTKHAKINVKQKAAIKKRHARTR